MLKQRTKLVLKNWNEIKFLSRVEHTHKKAPVLLQLVSLHLGHFVPLQNGLSNEPVYGAEYNKVHLDHDS